MRDRWRAVGVLAAALFAVNVVARVINRFGLRRDDRRRPGVAGMFVVIGLILARGVPLGPAVPGGPLEPLTSPLRCAVALAADRAGRPAAGRATDPFAGGAGAFFAQIWLYLAAAGGGGVSRLPGAHRAGPGLPVPAAQAVRRGEGGQAPPASSAADPPQDRAGRRRGGSGQVGVVGGEAQRAVERHRARVALLDLEEGVRGAPSRRPRSASAADHLPGQALPTRLRRHLDQAQPEPAALAGDRGPAGGQQRPSAYRWAKRSGARR